MKLSKLSSKWVSLLGKGSTESKKNLWTATCLLRYAFLEFLEQLRTRSVEDASEAYEVISVIINAIRLRVMT